MKKALFSLLFTFVAVNAGMKVDMVCHIGDQEIVNARYTKNQAAHFEYNTTSSLTDTLKRVLRCSLRFDDNTTIHKLAQSSLLHTLTLGLASHAALFTIQGAIVEETYGYSVTISKGMLGSKEIFKDEEKKALWGEPVRFYLTEDIYIRITAKRDHHNDF